MDPQNAHVIELVPRERLVVRTPSRDGGEALATRFVLRPVDLALDPSVREACARSGATGGLPDAIAHSLEGYRVRAKLGPIDGIPDIVDAGVTRDMPHGTPPSDPSVGYPYVTTRWIDGGALLADAQASLSLAAKLATLTSVVRLVATLHERGVSHGNIRSDTIAVTTIDARASLVSLRAMREGGPAEEDVTALGRLAAWLLARELPDRESSPLRDELAWWAGAIEACASTDADHRPSARDLARGAPHPIAAVGDADATVVDTSFRAPPSASAQDTEPDPEPRGDRPPAPERTIVVPDDEPPAPPVPIRPRGRKVGVAPRPGWGETVHVRDDGVAHPRPAPAAKHGQRSSARGTGAAAIVIGGALVVAALVLGLVAVIVVRCSSGDDDAPDDTKISSAVPAPVLPIARCDGDAPSRVVIARLKRGRPVPRPPVLATWAGALPPDAVVIRRRQSGRRDEDRTIELEASRASWPEWDAIVAGAGSGRDACTRIGAALAARGVAARTGTGGIELSGGDPIATEDRIGTVAALAEPSGHTFGRVLDWLEPMRVAPPTCVYRQDGWGGGTIVITCDVTSTRAMDSRIRLTAVLAAASGETARLPAEEIDVRSGARVQRSYERASGFEEIGSGCDCEVETLSAR